MSISIQRSRATVRDLSGRLQQAYQRDDVRLVRRTTVVRDLLVHYVPIDMLGVPWGFSISCIYPWRQAFLLRGLDSLGSHHGGGHRPTLPPRQKKRLVELLEAGPLIVGCEMACWTSVLIRVLINRCKPPALPGDSPSLTVPGVSFSLPVETWRQRKAQGALGMGRDRREWASDQTTRPGYR